MYMYMVNLTNNIVSQHSCLVVLCCSWLPQSVNILYQSVNSACMLGSTILLSIIIIIIIIIIIDNYIHVYWDTYSLFLSLYLHCMCPLVPTLPHSRVSAGVLYMLLQNSDLLNSLSVSPLTAMGGIAKS